MLQVVSIIALAVVAFAVSYHFAIFLQSRKDLETKLVKEQQDRQDGEKKTRELSNKLVDEAKQRLNDTIGATDTRLTKGITDLDAQFKTMSENIVSKNGAFESLDVKGTVFFGKGDPSPVTLQKTINDNKKSSLQFTLLNDKDESLEIWGANVDSQVKPTLQHKFDGAGNASHTGSMTASSVKLNDDASLGIMGTSGVYKKVVTVLDPKTGTSNGTMFAADNLIGGKVFVDSGVVVTSATTGPFIERKVGTDVKDTYGFGHFDGNSVRAYASKDNPNATLNLSLSSKGTYEDIVSVNHQGATSVKNDLTVGGKMCVQDTCLSQTDVASFKSGCVQSSNGKFKACMQDDGNFVVYKDNINTVWTSNPQPTQPTQQPTQESQVIQSETM